MITKIAEYTVKEDTLDDVVLAIKAFTAAVHEHEPQTFYEAYRRGQTPEFVHVMKFPNHELEEVHIRAPYTAAFVAALYPNCEKEPVFTTLTAVE
jgi:quinol monooxygenase YgiN